MQDTPFYVISESYGGKMAAAYGVALHKGACIAVNFSNKPDNEHICKAFAHLILIYHLGQSKSNTQSKIQLFLLKLAFTAAHWILMINLGTSYPSYNFFMG